MTELGPCSVSTCAPSLYEYEDSVGIWYNLAAVIIARKMGRGQGLRAWRQGTVEESGYPSYVQQSSCSSGTPQACRERPFSAALCSDVKICVIPTQRPRLATTPCGGLHPSSSLPLEGSSLD